MKPRSDLHPYQHDAIDSLLADDGRGLVAVMGSGKTAVALHAAADLKAAGKLKKPMVVAAPLLIAETVWKQEAALWQDTANLNISLVLGCPKKRLAIIDQMADVYVTNYDNIKWLSEQILKRGWTLSVLVADESSKIKSPTAQRTRTMLELAMLARRRWTLTGTPRGQQLTDVWAPAQMVTRGGAFPPFYPWRVENFFTNDIYEQHWFPRSGVDAQIAEQLKPFTYVVDRSAFDTRPPVVEIIHDVPLDERASAAYEAIDEDLTRFLALEISSRPISVHEMAVVGKLSQICSGAIYDDTGACQKPHDRRLDMLAEIHEAHDRPTLVFANFRHEIERIQDRVPTAEELTAKRIEAWNAGKIEMLVAHPASAGHGVNLQHSSDTLVWFSLPWPAELYAQANARLARQGQRGTVNIHIMLSRGRIDEIARRVVHQRLADQDRLIAALT
jgi:SNF2 family DNA or RNA helicase